MDGGRVSRRVGDACVFANGVAPPGEPTDATVHGDGELFVWLPSKDGLAGMVAGDDQGRAPRAVKLPWWRGAGVRAPLAVEGRRLDGPAPLTFVLRVEPRFD